MKKYRVELATSLDNKIDIRDVTVDGDKFNQGENWIGIIVQIGDKSKKFSIPREQIKRVEELPE